MGTLSKNCRIAALTASGRSRNPRWPASEICQVGHPRDVTSLRLRRDRAALIAWSQTSPDMALSCAGFTRSFDIRAVAAALVDADAFDMWPESNGGCGSYSMAGWMTFARPSPPIFAA